MKFHKVITFGFVEIFCDIYTHTMTSEKLCNPVLYLYMEDSDILLVTNDKHYFLYEVKQFLFKSFNMKDMSDVFILSSRCKEIEFVDL